MKMKMKNVALVTDWNEMGLNWNTNNTKYV